MQRTRIVDFHEESRKVGIFLKIWASSLYVFTYNLLPSILKPRLLWVLKNRICTPYRGVINEKQRVLFPLDLNQRTYNISTDLRMYARKLYNDMSATSKTHSSWQFIVRYHLHYNLYELL